MDVEFSTEDTIVFIPDHRLFTLEVCKQNL